MGGNTGRIIMPIAVGIGAGFLAPHAAGMAGKTAALKGSTIGKALGEFAAETAFSWGSALAIGGATMQAMTPEPQLPDYSQQFAGAQDALNYQHSFARKSTSDLENSLEFGSEYEKNQAFDELQRRGEDANRLNEIRTRSERSDENQADIDRYIAENAPPSQEEMQNLMTVLYNQEEQDLEKDVDERVTEMRQIQAKRGLGSSNATSQFEVRLAELEDEGKRNLKQSVQDRVLNYQTGVQGLYNQGLNRLLSGANYEDTVQLQNIGLADQQRALNQNFRNTRAADSTNLGLERFRAEMQGLNRQFDLDSQRANNMALMGLGGVQLAAGNYFGGNNNSNTSTKKEETNNPYLGGGSTGWKTLGQAQA